MTTPNYPGYTMCFIDCETTGLNNKLHNIFQLSGIVTDPDLTVLEKFDLRFRPFSLEYIDAGSTEKTGMTKEKLENLEMTAPEAYQEFIKVLSRHCNKYNKADKMQMVAYNATFDTDFIREFFIKNGDNYFGSWFFTPSICVMQAAAWFTQRVRGALPNFKLGTVCKSAGLTWNEDEAHDALYDVEKTIELYTYLKEYVPQL
jgi:DNA polymerase-3 subunit epsilon